MRRHQTLMLATILTPLTVLGAATFCATSATAQFVTVPFASQRSEITQTVGLTQIGIVYHRPLVNDRPVWGALVPYDQVWRAGANENTTITFSTDVKAYCLQNDVNLEEALQWADTAVLTEERFETLGTKGQLLAKLGDTRGALEIFQLNAKKHPDTWFVDVGLARGYSAVGDLKKAAEHMRKGAARAPEAQRAVYEGLAQQLESGKSI